MKLILNLKYTTTWGQTIYVCGNHLALGNNNETLAVALSYNDTTHWSIEVDVPVNTNECIDYYYFVKNENGTILYTATKYTIYFNKKSIVNVYDTWLGNDDATTVLFTQPFENIFYPKKSTVTSLLVPSTCNYVFSIKAPQLKAYETVCIVGNIAKLGAWDDSKPFLLKKVGDRYVGTIQLSNTITFTYKYGVYNTKTKLLVLYENGTNRWHNHIAAKDELTILQDGIVMLNYTPWKGTGVAIPVFSLRSKAGLGTGEFNDIKQLANWCKVTGVKLIQLLPINDTLNTKTNADSYPYSANSSFALHPLYINLKSIGSLPATHTLEKVYRRTSKKLNDSPQLEFEAVIKYKLAYLRALFMLDDTTFELAEYNTFFSENSYWLKPYAAYCYLRDKYKTANFYNWKQYASVTPKQLESLTKPTTKHYSTIQFWYYVQYHLHIQLKQAVAHAHNLGIALKGDIPIGIGRTSCDAWQHPQLFNMNEQAGAPPDDFAVKGQNWGFPTYNWEAMQQNNYAWWRQRFAKMSDYFDAFRIDHILGFFRIWSIPTHAVEGIMGRFVPAIPVYAYELPKAGLPMQTDRYCKPYNTEQYLNQLFGEYTTEIIHTFFEHTSIGTYELLPQYTTQKLIEQYFDNITRWPNDFKYKLYDCIANVILWPTSGNNFTELHFNIAMKHTYSYNALSSYEKEKLDQLYINYYYERQNEFWKIEANKKLPSIVHQTNMLVCGEDLGMVPNCVPGVLNSLSMLSLEVQRMPKATNTSFVHLQHVPYLSVATPSTHDMSPLRAWWEEDKQTTQNYYNNILGNYGAAPQYAEPWIIKQIIEQHLYAQSMMSIFQLQDLMALNATLRTENPQDERINVPANPNHYWSYRIPVQLDELLKNKAFNDELYNMITTSGR